MLKNAISQRINVVNVLVPCPILYLP